MNSRPIVATKISEEPFEIDLASFVVRNTSGRVHRHAPFRPYFGIMIPGLSSTISK